MRLNVMSWEIPKQLASGNWILGLFNTCRAVLFKGLSFRHDDLLGQILSRARYYPVSSHLQRIKPVGRGSARIGIVTADAGGTLSEVPLATLSGGQAANATDSCIRWPVRCKLRRGVRVKVEIPTLDVHAEAYRESPVVRLPVSMEVVLYAERSLDGQHAREGRNPAPRRCTNTNG